MPVAGMQSKRLFQSFRFIQLVKRDKPDVNNTLLPITILTWFLFYPNVLLPEEFAGYSGDIIQYSLPSLSDRIKFYAMARISRLVVPDYPHHITPRGVRSMDIFNCDEDRHAYIEFMVNEGRRFGVRFLAWCLMDDHVHLLAAARYVELNPVKAGMVAQAWEYPWSSCRFHCSLQQTDLLVEQNIFPEMVGEWSKFLHQHDENMQRRIIQGTRTGHPVGDDIFLSSLESQTGRILQLRQPGRPRKNSIMSPE